MSKMFFANECSVCKSTDFPKPCSRCYLISYCGSAHQVKDWPMHKDFCDVIWSIVREQRVSHIYEKLCGVDLDTWIKERKRMCLTVRSKLKRPLFLQEEQMLLLPRSCFVCHNTKQDLLTTCPVCLCANFCTEHPSSSQHDKDCLSLKLFYEFNGKMQDPAKLKTILTLINEIAETTKFYNSSDIPQSMVEYLNQQIKGENHMFEQACASNLLSMSLTLFSALKKLNLESASAILVHVRCNVSDSSIWELLLHFLPNLTALNIVFIEQRKSQKLKVDLCDECCSKNKKMTLETNELLYKNYVKSKIYKKPDIFAYLNTEISKNVDENSEWDFLLENLSRIGSPLVLTSVTEKMAKMVSESLRSTFWPSLICYEGPNDFGALDPLREWTDGGVSKINQHLIITEGRIQCKASTFCSDSFLSKKKRENSTSPLMCFYSNVCQVCRSNDISIYCKFCSMIFYCSEPHRKEDWCKHKDICQVIQRLLKKSGMKNIFDGEIDLMGGQKTDPESWLRAKLNLLSKAESEFGKKLWVFQQQMILFPKTCFVCHESEVNKLKTCECGISLCKKHNGSPIHKEICKDFQLSWQLFEKEKLPDPLPKSKYVSDVKEKLPASIEEFMDLHLTLENEATAKEIPHFNRIVIAELLTKPLTLLYAIKKLNIPEFKNDNDSENNSTIVVHVIGSKNSENVSYEFWDIFFNWIPNLETLSITFIGPETMTLNLNRTFHEESKERNLSIKSYSADYEQFVQSCFFVKPDIIVGYNLDIHECVNDKCSCKENILNIQKLNVPFVMTSGTKERAQKDHKRLSKVLERFIKYDIFDLNPFASLVPERDFETEGLRFSNKYILIYCELDQAPDAFQNSKLRKQLLERQEAEKLADTSHLSDFEKALRNLNIESAPISSTENAESKTKSLNPRNSFLFDAARYELKYMLRNFKGTSKSVSCTNSEFKTDPKFKSGLGSDKEKTSEENLLSSTQPSEHKLESGSTDKDLQFGKENSLLKLHLTQDSESKSEFGSAKDEVLEDNFSFSIEDSECLSENGPATQLLFKENLLFSTEGFEDVPESGCEHIWNEIFNENTLTVSEDSAPELESGYSNVKICKENLFSAIINSDCKSQSGSAKEEISEKNLSTSEQDLEFTSESLELSIIEDSECTTKTKSPNDKLFKDPSTEDSPPKLEIGSAQLETFSITESSKSESRFDKDDISKKNLWPIAEEDVESNSESEISDGGTSMKHLWLSSDDSESESVSNKILVDFASDVEPESAMEDSFKKNVLFTAEQGLELESETEIANGGSLKEDVLLLTENLESKFAKDETKKNLSEIVKGKSSMDNVWPAIEDSESKPEYMFGKDEVSKKNILSTSKLDLESKPEFEIANGETSMKYLCPVTEDSKSEPDEDKISVDSTFKLESKSEIANENLLEEDVLPISEDSESITESKSTKSEDSVSITGSKVSECTLESLFRKDEEFMKSLMSFKEDVVSKSESAFANVEILKENSRPFTEDAESKSESEFTKSETLMEETLKEDLSPTTEEAESKSESGFTKSETLIEDLLLITKDSNSKSESGSLQGEILKENLLSSSEDSESKCKEFESTKNQIFRETLLSMTEGSEHKLESGSSDDLVKEDLLLNLATIQDLECDAETGISNDKLFNENLFSTNGDLESKTQSEIVNGETLKENSLLLTEDFESKSANAVTLKEGLFITTENSECKTESKSDSTSTLDSKPVNVERLLITDFEYNSESEIVNEEALKENLLSKTDDSESKLESRSADSERLLVTTEDSENKLESGSADNLITERLLIKSSAPEDSECELGTEAVKKIEAESKTNNGETLKKNLLITIENFESKSESGFEVSASKLESRSADSERLLVITEHFENKLESGSTDNLNTERLLIKSSVTEDSECKSEIEAAKKIEEESETASGETSKENLLTTIENSESKSESGSEVSESKLESRSADSERLLVTTEDSENKLESGSVDSLIIERLFIKSSVTEDSKCKSETEAAKKIETESETANGETSKENLLAIIENSKSESESEVSESKSESESEISESKSADSERLLVTTEDSENKLESGSVENLITERLLIKSFVTEDLECESETEAAKKIEAESETANGETLKKNSLTTIENSKSKPESVSEVSVSKVESKSADSEILVTTEDFENKLESGSVDILITERILIEPSTTEDSECESETERAKEIEAESATANGETLKENLLTTIENSESKSESGAEVSESKVESGPAEDFGKENVLLISSSIENSVYKVETAPFNDEVFPENLLSMTENFESKSAPGSSIVETLKEESSKKSFLPTNVNSESKSDPGSDKDEMLKEISLSTTEDSECKSESGPTNEELLRENLLLKEEIRRLKENEELIKSENSYLKGEICRLREEKTSI